MIGFDGLLEAAYPYLAEQAARTAMEFARPLPVWVPKLEWGEQAEFRAATGDLGPRVLVSRHEPDFWRVRYQIAHEVFHWLCTPPRTFHWTHEMLAVEVAVQAMVAIGEEQYARQERERLSRDAESLSLHQMLTTDLTPPYPEGTYGRAWLTGQALSASVGWEAVKRIVSIERSPERSLTCAWLADLPAADRLAAESILGAPSPDWV